jgi:GMP synthase (glutamine-hydrolysing)
MSEPRLKTRLLVQAILRRYDQEAIPVYIRRNGDPDAGTVLLKIAISRDNAVILSQARDADGRAGWLRLGGEHPLSDQDAEAAIEKAIRRDPDLYVIEIEDSKARILVEGPLL